MFMISIQSYIKDTKYILNPKVKYFSIRWFMEFDNQVVNLSHKILSEKFGLSLKNISKFLSLLAMENVLVVKRNPRGSDAAYRYQWIFKQSATSKSKRRLANWSKAKRVETEDYNSGFMRRFLSTPKAREISSENLLMLALLSKCNENGLVENLGTSKIASGMGSSKDTVRKYLDLLIETNELILVCSGGTGSKFLGVKNSVYLIREEEIFGSSYFEMSDVLKTIEGSVLNKFQNKLGQLKFGDHFDSMLIDDFLCDLEKPSIQTRFLYEFWCHASNFLSEKYKAMLTSGITYRKEQVYSNYKDWRLRDKLFSPITSKNRCEDTLNATVKIFHDLALDSLVMLWERDFLLNTNPILIFPNGYILCKNYPL